MNRVGLLKIYMCGSSVARSEAAGVAAEAFSAALMLRVASSRKRLIRCLKKMSWGSSPQDAAPIAAESINGAAPSL
jgi:hypothetical protein